jgi:hypothetical protein
MSAELVRSIVSDNRYMVLATAGEDGEPWSSPVFFAASPDCREFYWISSPEVTHSRNLAVRPSVSIVIFDSRVPVGDAEGTVVYLSGTAGLVPDDDFERGLSIYPGPPERGARRIDPAELRGSGRYRLYRAIIDRHWLLCPRESGRPCEPHGKYIDHRLEVEL